MLGLEKLTKFAFWLDSECVMGKKGYVINNKYTGFILFPVFTENLILYEGPACYQEITSRSPISEE